MFKCKTSLLEFVTISKVDLAKTVASRTKLIEVSTEATLMPLLQLYLVLINIFVWKSSVPEQRIVSDKDFSAWILQVQKILQYLSQKEILRLISSFASILTIAGSYTSNYRNLKDNALGTIPTIIYFFYICFATTARCLNQLLQSLKKHVRK